MDGPFARVVILSEAKDLNASTARLAKVFGTSTALWLNLQAAVDAWDADREARSWKPLTRFSDAAD